ncbi:hypothetical protein M422DRAFT_222417 [Sphaerobolus stellatus SS14]|nr:hypothetical protein M422DRAFT_222417 [Sphaerobolus stellatus SS14]
MTEGQRFQLLTFVPSSEYIANPPEASNYLKTSKNALGDPFPNRVFHGYKHENPSEEAYLLTVSNGDAFQHHEDEAILSRISSASGPKLDIYFKQPTDAIKAFRAPIVEIAFFTMKPEYKVEAIARHLDTLTGQETSTVLAATWAKTNKEEVAVMVVGWESLKAHEEVTKNPTPEIQALFGDFMPKVDLKVVHVKFNEA